MLLGFFFETAIDATSKVPSEVHLENITKSR